MSGTIIYGASDDLLEIDGAWTEELNPPDCGGEDSAYIGCSDGTLLSLRYGDDGANWTIRTVRKGSLWERLIPALGDDTDEKHAEFPDATPYSDIAVFSAPLEWVTVGSQQARLKRPRTA